MNRRVRKIGLASILKPVDEPRMFERIGICLAKNGYQVSVFGTLATSQRPFSNVSFSPHKIPRRLGLQRVLLRWKILWKVILLRPNLLIVCTHELLGIAMVYKFLFWKRIIYDVQENYYLNITHTEAFPRGVRKLIASLVRMKEKMASLFVSHFLLAEKCYADEIGFVRGRSTVIENKCKIPEGFQRKPDPDYIRLIFTGTLAASTGIFRAIELAKKLYTIEPQIRMTILGHCAQTNVLRMIQKEVHSHSFINLVGGQEFVDHAKIMEAIGMAHFGFIFYPPSPHIQHKMPTKLFEYLACQLPILLNEDSAWIGCCAPCHAALVIDERGTLASLAHAMRTCKFYLAKPEYALWEAEEQKLLAAIDQAMA